MYRYLGNYWDVKCRKLAQVIKYLIYVVDMENDFDNEINQLNYLSESNQYDLEVLVAKEVDWHYDAIDYSLGLVLQSNNYIVEVECDDGYCKQQLLKPGDVFFFKSFNRHRLIKAKKEKELQYPDFFIMCYWDFCVSGFGEDKMPSKKDLRKLIKQALNNFE
jgi:hypothetical protein